MFKSKKQIVALAGGGTGGPTTPLLAVAEQMRKEHPEVGFVFIGTAHGPEKALASGANIPFYSLPVVKLRRYFSLRNVIDVFILPYSVLKAAAILLRTRARVVVSAGSFVAVPTVWAAKLLGLKVLIHQQDVEPTLSNRLTKKFATVVTCTFEEQKKDFPNAIVIGNPVRQGVLEGDRSRGLTEFDFVSDKPVVLIFGGGTGAQKINDLTEEALPALLEAGLQILHITGPTKYKAEASTEASYKPFPLLTSEMADAYAIASVVVGRAGLATISELSQKALPAIIIPISDSHQEANAELLSKHEAAVILSEKNLQAAEFGQTIINLVNDVEQKNKLAKNISELMQHDAAHNLMQHVYKLALNS